MGENKLNYQFPPMLGFAELVNIKGHQALYQVNERLRLLVTNKLDTCYIDESHDGKIVRISEGKSLKEAFVNHYSNYDPEDCPFHQAWVSKVTSVPNVYADYITEEDLKTKSFPQLCFVDVRIPFDEDHADMVNDINETITGMKNGRCKIDQCLHLTVYPGEVVKKYIPVLAVRLPVEMVYQFLKVFSDDRLLIQDKRFRAIVNRPGNIKNHSVRIFNGDANDDWLRYVISFKEL